MRERSSARAIGPDSEPGTRVLAVLPHEVRQSVRPHLKPVPLTRGRVLCEVDEPLSRVYFVAVGAVSPVTAFEDGTSAEMATMGPDGVIGIDTRLGGEQRRGDAALGAVTALLGWAGPQGQEWFGCIRLEGKPDGHE